MFNYDINYLHGFSQLPEMSVYACVFVEPMDYSKGPISMPYAAIANK